MLTEERNFDLGLDKWVNIAIIVTVPRGCSSSGRAPPCQGGGSEFEPRHPLHKTVFVFGQGLFFYALIGRAQLPQQIVV